MRRARGKRILPCDRNDDPRLCWRLFDRMMTLRRPACRYIALLETVLTTNFWKKL